MTRAALVALALAAGCSEAAVEPLPPAGADAGTPDASVPVVDAGPPAPAELLEIVPLDLWGRDLSGDVRVAPEPPARPSDGLGPGVRQVALPPAAVELAVRVSAADHVAASLAVAWDPEADPPLTWRGAPAPARLAASTDRRLRAGVVDTVHTLYTGLDHAWFAATGPPPTRNRVRVLMDGEEAWAAVHADVLQARERVTWSTWWWESDFELLRPPGSERWSASRRRPNTALGLAAEPRAAHWRVLVNRFWGANTDYSQYLNTDAELRALAERGGDRFEVMLQANEVAVPVGGRWTEPARDFDFVARVRANPRYAARELRGAGVSGMALPLTLDAASWHQKGVVVDGRVAYVSGMNTKGDDWDGSAHLVYDWRRMGFDAAEEDRLAVQAREELPELGPRKDWAVRVEGPAARDVEALLRDRWHAARTGGALHAANATDFEPGPAGAEPADGVPLQVVATMPPPWSEQSIRETHAKAFAAAESYIVVEDQYFRAPLMNGIIAQRMLDRPWLQLLVVTLEVGSEDPGKKYTHLSDDLFRTLFPDRYLLLQLRTTDVAVDEGFFWDDVVFTDQPIYTHSKLRLVDDRYVSVGSCNMNNRGYLFEGELDVAVLDKDLASETRRRLLENLAGPERAGELTGVPAEDFALLRRLAAQNEASRRWWAAHGEDLDADEIRSARAAHPIQGFVFPLSVDSDYLFDPGPDLF